MNVEKKGLNYLVNFHRMTANTYMGWNFGKTLSIKMKVILIIANICLFCNCTYFIYSSVLYFVLLKTKHSQVSGKKSFLPYILQLLSHTGFIVATFLCFFMNIFKGKAILIFLFKQDLHIDTRIERSIATKIIMVLLIICLLIEFGYSSGCLFSYNDLCHLSYSKMLLDYITKIFNKNIQFVLFSMIAYQCFIIEQRFKEITENFKNLSQFKFLSGEIFKISNLVKGFNCHINSYLFTIFLYYFFCSINNITVFYFDHGKSMMLATIGTVEGFLLMFIFCITCDKIEKGYEIFLEKFETLHEQNFNRGDYLVDYPLINRLYILRDDMCLTAFNLYKINTKMLMSFVSLIITFAVILMQTEL